jgi:Sterol carrier protein domain
MARVLSLDGLTGMPAGKGHLTVQVTDDPFIAGRYVLDGMAGELEVRRSPAAEPAATLTAAGLAGLVYGVLDPDELNIRGLGEIAGDAAAQLQTLFPRSIPYLHAAF